MKNIKRQLGLILAMVLLMGCLPISVFAQEMASGTCGDNATWVLDEREILTISGTGSIADSDAFWYSYSSEIQSIIVSEGITKINDGTFAHLANTTSISLPDSLKSIGAAAFYGNSNLSTITIPRNVESMGFDVFYDCSKLTEIFFTGDSPTFDDLTFNNITATAYYPANNLTWTEEVMQDYGGDITWVAYNEEHSHEYGTDHKCECGAIGGTCGQNLTWTFDEETGIFTIDGTGAMPPYDVPNAYPWHELRDSITEIVIAEGITEIGMTAFAGCTNLTTLQLPNSLTWIGEGAFSGCSILSSVEISKNITVIGDYAFQNCSGLQSIVIPDSVINIYTSAFNSCSSLKKITFEGDVPTIHESAFSNVIATAYYPANNETWTDSVKKNYGGTITWIAYGDTTEAPDITGYSAGLSTTTPTTTTGEKVYVSVAVNHAEETTFNAGELVFAYNPTYLSFNQTDSTLGNATVKAANGTLTLEDYGAAKNCGNGIYTLVFDAVADGNATVKLTSAAFSNQENAAASDLIAGVAYPDSVSIAVSKKSFAVTLPDGMTGAATVTDGESYTFHISNQNYTYSNVAATVDGQSVSVTDNGDGSYTISSVSGVLKITATRTPKSYKVSFTGTAAADITGASGTATYGTDYKFTIPTADGWAYSLGGITIGGNSYTGYSADGSEYTIPGAAITGEIVITVNKAQTTASVTVTGSGAGAAAGYDATAEIGESYTLTITPENGYNYTVTATMGGKPVGLAQNGNKYTIAEVTGNIVFTVERTVIVSGVTVSEYVSVDGNKVWLIQNKVTLAERKVPTYNGSNMFWSEEYDAYCYLVIAATLSEEDAKAAIGIADGTAVAVDYGMDVNMTGNVDANDAQLTYNIYNAYYDSFSETATMEKFLRADVNKDGKVNTTDSAAIINKILNG